MLQISVFLLIHFIVSLFTSPIIYILSFTSYTFIFYNFRRFSVAFTFVSFTFRCTTATVLCVPTFYRALALNHIYTLRASALLAIQIIYAPESDFFPFSWNRYITKSTWVRFTLFARFQMESSNYLAVKVSVLK